MDQALKSEDAEAAEDQTAAASDASPEPSPAAPMPPATFDVLVGMLSTQAMVALGLVPNPATGKAERMPELAKHFIDLLGVIETKTTGNLQQSEKTALDSALHHLHLAYVQITKEDAGEDSSNESKQQ